MTGTSMTGTTTTGPAMTSACAVIPVYNHPDAIGAVVMRLLQQDLACILVDDGSEPDCARLLDRLAQTPRVFLRRLPVNQGKGAAVMEGLAHARTLGFSHALQVDADGQHDLAVIPEFLAAGTRDPRALICGYPIYDASVPTGRKLGRYLTHVWVWINTTSFDIRDSMCGFRLYPLEPTLTMLAGEPIGQRMDFDIDILVRLHWRGMAMIWLPVAVVYPENGVSHFRLWRDNLLISRMHARLFFTMLRRRLLPAPGRGPRR